MRVQRSGVHHVPWDNLDAGAREWVQALATCSCTSFAASYLPDYQPAL
jgi:hypothetical protein